MIIGITIGIFAALTIRISSSFQPGAASIANWSNATTLSIPVADTPFYREIITVTSCKPINATHVEVSLSGNGILTLPNNTETIAVNSTSTV